MADEARTYWFGFLGSFGKVRTTGRCINLGFGERCVLDKKMNVKFGITTHRSKGLLDCIHVDFWVLKRSHRLEAIRTLSLLLMIYLGIVGCTS